MIDPMAPSESESESRSESDSSAPNTGDSTTAVSEDFIDAVEARQDAEDAAAAAAEELAAEEPPAPRAQRSIDFTAAAASVDGQ